MLNTIIDFVSQPAVLSTIVGFLVTLLPKATLDKLYATLTNFVEKFPILGLLVKIVRLYLDRVRADQQARIVNNAASVAGVLVNGAEQMMTQKAGNKLDGATAAVQITKTLEDRFKLDTDTARKVTEQAVYQMNLANKPKGW